jgi:3D (Asp-Asp-Asp) domain-containing protein
MKKNINKTKIIKIFIFSFLFIFFTNISISLAACGWYTKYLSPPPPNLIKSQMSDCGTKPDNESRADPYFCYCDKPAQTSATDPDQPKLVIPDLQITIPGVVYSEADITCTGEGSDRTCQSNFIGKYIAGIYKYALGIIGIIAVIVMMIGGVMWIVAAGSASRVTEAKAWIGASITGLILMLCSYTILSMINPALVNFNPLAISQTEINKFVENRTGAAAQSYENKTCPTQEELNSGTQFYATGYYRPPYGTDLKSLCMIAMNCSCPNNNAKDRSKNCDAYFSKFKGYAPCQPFTCPTSNNDCYCNRTSGNTSPQPGDIAADTSCSGLGYGSKVCATDKNGNRTTYTVRDTGGAIKGRRIDIWSGTDINVANQNTGNVTLKSGACQ